MYSLKQLFTQSPAKIAATVTTVLTTASLAGWSPLSPEENLALAGVVSALLLLFYVDPLTSSNAKLSTLQDHTLSSIDLGKQIAPVTNLYTVTSTPAPPKKRPPVAAKKPNARKRP